ncbi:MAG: MBL fold metallo-hydrolase [Tissierellia bacterium]|nr:MBL fold metallo-hydrolase [Tissierellia bacterium]MDD4726574.1 MBL fold metallo-hydrolase [Tissierellia bacterium]
MPIKFCSLSSGSSGNCQYIECNNTKILIDAGFSGKRVEELLSSIDVSPKSIDGILVTHEHIDHTLGVGVLSRRYDIPIFANSNTWVGMEPIIKSIKEKNTKVFKTNSVFDFKDLSIYPINVSHDAIEPVGYIIYYKQIKLSIITDTGWIPDNIRNEIKNSNLYFMESNHDERMLREGSYPWPLKKRIMSSHGHLSNMDAGEILADVLCGNEEIVILAHLSQDNNLPDLAYNTVRECIISQGIDTSHDVNLSLSHRDRASNIYIID